MSSSKLRSGWDAQGALKRAEQDPAFSFPQCYEENWFPSHQVASNYVPKPPPINSTMLGYQYVRDEAPSADECYRAQKQQEQQRQGSKPAPPSPTVSIISTYGQNPMYDIPNVRDKSHHYVRDHRRARRGLGPPVWAQRKPSVSRPTPQKSPRSQNPEITSTPRASMTLNYGFTDLSNYEGPNIKHANAQTSNIARNRPPVQKRKNGRNGGSSEKMQDRGTVQDHVPKQHSIPEQHPVPKQQPPVPKQQHPIPKQRPGEKESGCCSVM
ncbi:hypothetical protein BTUL_0123g00140 [Botrytis tulipae]|uniref:Uncharacterized protein n=1 Tax=Botrytis tulipae TaxID=87230 RepID=A0A4Z1EJ97_9HELO|nr:hypothetical protein BTUL_0123g00140 [Botrytis tulipae]